MFETMKKFAACVLATIAFCLIVAPGIAWAGVAPAIVFADAEAGALPVSLNAGADVEGVRAFKLTLAVEGAEEAGASVGFEYDGSLDADVREVRSSTVEGVRQVSLYVASKSQDLLTGAEQALGKLIVASKDAASVNVSVTGFEAVNAAHGDLGDLGLALPEEMQVQAKAENGSTDPIEEDRKGNDRNNNDRKDNDRKNDDSDKDTNVSPGAPSGTDSSLVATGDSLLPLVATLAAIALVSAVIALVVVLRSRKPGDERRS